MTYEFLKLPAFACLGQEREDLLANCRQWVAQLWAQTMPRIPEVLPLGIKARWGLMSDPEIFLAPWGGDRGRYLAGWEVPVGTQSFGNWTVWEVPAMDWMRVPCRVDRIDLALENAHSILKLHPQWRWEGSVHELYPPGFCDPKTDHLHLMMGITSR